MHRTIERLEKANRQLEEDNRQLKEAICQLTGTIQESSESNEMAQTDEDGEYSYVGPISNENVLKLKIIMQIVAKNESAQFMIQKMK
ncbi:unnamed protein product [Adineta ricciae]|uniref:Uncharacterized protein n=1 Tax=Adineta ricciae TaxID=249248 RepID=A0A815SFF8_ADIRI|nr:unnamed protein product [Adineta ricciae]